MKEWADAILEAAIVLMVLYLVCWPVKIKGNSMLYTFAANDRVLMNRICGELHWYQRGDFVVFTAPEKGINLPVMKRVIAMEGDIVKINDGNVFLNNECLIEDYVTGETEGELEIKVGEGQLFVLGDNRAHSTDSRNFGCIFEKDVEGTVYCRFFPLQKFQLFFQGKGNFTS